MDFPPPPNDDFSPPNIKNIPILELFFLNHPLTDPQILVLVNILDLFDDDLVHHMNPLNPWNISATINIPIVRDTIGPVDSINLRGIIWLCITSY